MMYSVIFGGNEVELSKRGYGLVVECNLPKVKIRVRFPLPARADVAQW